MSSILNKLNVLAYATESLIRQGVEVKKSGDLGAVETLKFVNHLRKKLFEVLRLEKLDINSVFSEKIYAEKSDLEVKNYLNEEILNRLIKNVDNVLDSKSLENLNHVNELLKNGEKVAFIANHLSELDPAIFDFLLQKNGFGDLSEQMSVVIGGEVKLSPFKNFWAKSVNRTYVFSENNMTNPVYHDFADEMGSFNMQSIKNLRNEMKEGSIGAVFIHPSGKRCRPNIKKDGKYIEDYWSGDKIARLCKILGVDKIVPVAIYGTENMHGPKSEKSGDDDSYISSSNIFYQVGQPFNLKSTNEEIIDESLRQVLLKEVNSLTKNPLLMYQVGLPKKKQMFFSKK